MHGRRGCLVLVGLVALATAVRAGDLEPRLRSDDPVVRHEALDVVAALPPARAVPLLVGALDSPDAFVRLRAAYLLGRLGDRAASALPALSEELYDVSLPVRTEAFVALVRIGVPATGPLRLRLADASQAATRVGRRVDFGGIPPAPAFPTRPDPERVAEALRSEDPREREEGAWMAMMLATYARTEFHRIRGDLQAACGDEDPFVAGRATAALALGWPDAPEIVQSAAALTERPSRFARRKGCELLALLRGGDVELARLMRGDDAELGELALQACAQGLPSPAILSAMLRFLSGPVSRDCRVLALSLLGRARAPLPEALGPLIALLDDPAPGIAPLAAQALQRYGTQALPALDTLSRLARDDARFVSALAAIGPPAEERLLELLGETRGYVRGAVLTGLGSLAAGSPRARAAVEDAARDPDPAVSRLAAGILERLAAIAPVPFERMLAELRAMDSPEAVDDRASRLVRSGTAGQIDALLSDPDWRLHATACAATLRREPAASLSSERRDLLLAALRAWPGDDPEPIRRRRDAWIGMLDRPHADDLPALEQLLRSDDAMARRDALEKLAGLGPQAARLTALLAERAAVADDVESGLAFRALQAVGTPAIAPLVPMLGSPNPRLRGLAAGVLAWLPADAVLPALTARRADPDTELRRVAAGLLGKLKAAGAPEELARWCEDPDAEVRALAVGGLGRAAVSDPREEWVALLCAAATGGDHAVAAQACTALGTLAGHSDAALSSLGAVLVGDDPRLRAAAAWQLARWPDRSRPFVDRALASGDPQVRASAVAAIGLKEDDAVERLRAVFQDAAREVRAAVLEKAGFAGALDLILKGLDDPEASVRYAAVGACGRLGARAGELLPALLDRWTEDRPELAHAFASLGVPALDAAFERAVAGGAAGYAPLFRVQGSNGFAYLLHRLSDGDVRRRIAAIRLLGAYGPEGRDARPALEELADDPETAGEVRDALARIGE